MDTFYIKQGDLWPPLVAYLKQANGEPIPLQQGDIVEIVITPRNKRREETVSNNVDIIDYDLAHVKYEWQQGDTDIAGQYQAEFIVTFAETQPVKIPNNGYFNIIIDHKLGEERSGV